MAELKTKATEASVAGYLAARASDEQAADCKTLMAMFEQATRQPPKMWGPSIVGHGSHRYTHASGRTGEMCLVGFAIRGRELVLYLNVDGETQQALLAKLGKHRKGNACVYIKRLADVDTSVLEQLVVGSIAALQNTET